MPKYCVKCDTIRSDEIELCPVCSSKPANERYFAYFNTTMGGYQIYDTWKSEVVSIHDTIQRLNNLTAFIES